MLSDTEKKKLRQQAPSALREGTVQDPPLTEDEGMLRVELDAEPGAIHKCPYQLPADGEDGPQGGDAVVVMESDGGNNWVLCWWRNG